VPYIFAFVNIKIQIAWLFIANSRKKSEISNKVLIRENLDFVQVTNIFINVIFFLHILYINMVFTVYRCHHHRNISPPGLACEFNKSCREIYRRIIAKGKYKKPAFISTHNLYFFPLLILFSIYFSRSNY